ncbi:MAG: 50S ribosomal protein L30 [Firmicutes bacterium]|nr:50S ribosomal protein L30 [Bacillota bacterium]
MSKKTYQGQFIKVTLIKSTIGGTKAQKATVQALGLKKIGQVKLHQDNPAIRGMVNKVSHLVKLEEA